MVFILFMLYDTTINVSSKQEAFQSGINENCLIVLSTESFQVTHFAWVVTAFTDVLPSLVNIFQGIHKALFVEKRYTIFV